jgi:hypothetical protein
MNQPHKHAIPIPSSNFLYLGGKGGYSEKLSYSFETSAMSDFCGVWGDA